MNSGRAVSPAGSVRQQLAKGAVWEEIRGLGEEEWGLWGYFSFIII